MKKHLIEFLISLALFVVAFFWIMVVGALLACAYYIPGIIIGVLGITALITFVLKT